MATDLEKLVVSLDADIRQLTNKLNKAGVAVEGFGRKADRDTAAAGKRISDNLSKATAHGGGGGTAGGLSYVQKQEFAHIGKALADEIAAGQSPLRALQVEGGRIVEAFSAGPGGVGGTFKALGSTLAGLVSPAALAAAGVLGIGGAAIYALHSFEETERAIKTGLLGIGAASGATVSDVRRIGAELAATQGISLSAGEDLALSLAKTGKIDVGSIGDVGKLARGFANVTGTSIGEAGKQLGDIFADPARGAETFQRLLGGVDAKTREYIRTLQAEGDQQGALKALLAAVTPELTRAAEATSGFASAWQKVENAASAASQAIGGALAHKFDPTPEQRLADLQTQRTAALAAPKGAMPLLGDQYYGDVAPASADVAGLDAEIAKLKAEIAAAEQLDAALRQHKQLAAKADPVAADLDASNPVAAQIRSTEALLKRGREVLATPGALDLLPDNGRDLKASLDGVQQRLEQLKTTAAQGGDALAAAARDADFRTATADLDGYALKVRTIQHDVENMRRELIATGDAARIQAGEAMLPKIEAGRIAAEQAKILNGDSKYAHGVSDVPEEYQRFYFAAAAKYNINPDLLAAKDFQESQYRPRAVSPSGAEGIAQLMPGTAREMGVTNPFDPEQSIMGGAKYLRKMMDKYGDDERTSLTAYNAGDGTVDAYLAGKGSLKQESRDYAPSILDKRSDFEKRSSADKAATDARTEAEHRLAEAQTGTSRAADMARLTDKALQEIRAAGLPIDDAARARAAAQAAELVKLAEAEKAATLAASIRHQRSDLGLSRDEAAVQDRVRGAGLDPSSGAGADLAGQLRQINAAGEVKSEATSSIQDLTHALIEGRSAGEAFHNVLQRLGEKVADKGIDSLVSSVFGGFTGGGGGGFGSALSSLFGGRFADGGFIANGLIRGPGGSRGDQVPILASPAEFSPSRDRVQAGLSVLSAIRPVRRFAA